MLRAMGGGGRWRQLDGLRFVAILPVLVDHVWMPGALPWIFAGTRVGLVGVRLFFVLSGFLITTILLRGTPLQTSGVRLTFLRNFYARRLLRIAPAYAVCVAAVVASDRAQYGAVWPWVA